MKTNGTFPTTRRPAHSRPSGKEQRGRTNLSNLEQDDGIFVAGVRELVDLVAPTSVMVEKNHLYVEMEGSGRYLRSFSVIGIPRESYAGWIQRITRLRLPLSIVLHLAPFEPHVILRNLDEATDLQRIMNGVASGTIRVFSVSLTICVHASTLARLEQRSSILLSQLRQQQLRVQGTTLLQDVAWQSMQPTGRETLFRRVNLDSGSLAMGLPFGSARVGTGDGPIIGYAENGEPVHFHPWSRARKMANPSIVLVGEVGSGKSYTNKVLVTGLMGTGEIDVLVLDKDDDFLALHTYLGEAESQRFDLAQGCHMNPLELPFGPLDAREAEPGTDLVSEFIDNHLMAFYNILLADVGTVLSRDHEAFLYQLTLTCLAEKGITGEEIRRDPNTLLRPAPSFADLLRTAHDMRAPTRDMKFALIERLERVSYLFKGETSMQVNRPLTVLSTRNLDEAHYPLMAWTARNFVARYRAQVSLQRFLVFVIEEASFILKHTVGRKFLEQSSRGFRKRGIAQVTVSQQPEDFLEEGRVIYANAGTAFLLGMKMAAIEKLKLTPALERILAHAQPGEALMRIGNEYAHIHVTASPAEHRLFTTDPVELKERMAHAAR